VTDERVKNVNIWQEQTAVTIDHHIYWNWVKGHSGDVNNEFCDMTTKSASESPPMIDYIYELTMINNYLLIIVVVVFYIARMIVQLALVSGMRRPEDG